MLKLNKQFSIEIKPVKPYNFDATVFKPSHYPDLLKVYETGKYWFAMRFNDKIYGIKMQNLGSISKQRVSIEIFSDSGLTKDEIKNIISELNFRFEFNRDISEFFKKFRNDKVLSPLLKKWYGMHGSCAQDLYGLLMIGIFLQNTVVKRTVQMTKSMLEKYGIKVVFDRKEVFGFWKPEDLVDVNEDYLRGLKVGYRAKSFIRLSKTFVEESINELELRKLKVDEIKKRLIKLYGVGPETARILLVEAFHHYEIFDHVSPWQQKIYSRLLFNKELVPVDKIISYVRTHWSEWAHLAVDYIWEDIFWRRKKGEKIDWLEKEIRL